MDPTFSRFDAAARLVVVTAQRTAAGAGREQVTSRFLLAAVAAVDPALADFVLGVDAGWWSRLAGPFSSVLPPTHNRPWDPGAQQALRAAVSHCDWQARRDVVEDAARLPLTPEHLLIGALGDPVSSQALAEWGVPVAAALERARLATGGAPVTARATAQRPVLTVTVRHAGPARAPDDAAAHAEQLDRARLLDARRAHHPGLRQGASDEGLDAALAHFRALSQAFPHDHVVRRRHVLALVEQGSWETAAAAADAAAQDADPLVRDHLLPIANQLHLVLATVEGRRLEREVDQRVRAWLRGPCALHEAAVGRAEAAALLALHDGRVRDAVDSLDPSDPRHASTLALALFRAGDRSGGRAVAARGASAGQDREPVWRSERRWAEWVREQVSH